MCSKIILVLALSIIPFEPIDGKPGATIEFLYASSLFRSNHLLANVTQLLELHDVPRAYNCLAHCLARKHNCKAFNYGANGTCTLLAESLCNNEAYELTPNEDFNYYDVLPTFDHEKKYYKDQYCQEFGKCSAKCYPRSPLVVNQLMSRKKAFEYCQKVGRKLAQPRSQAENVFYGEFGRRVVRDWLYGTGDSSSRTTTTKISDRMFKEYKFWLGITDGALESFWVYDDDNSTLSDSFSAWAVAQPDNGGLNGKTENCAVMELTDYNWIDVDCELELNFFCA